MQHVSIYIENMTVNCILKRSEEMQRQGKKNKNNIKIYWELNLDWTTKKVSNKIKAFIGF